MSHDLDRKSVLIAGALALFLLLSAGVTYRSLRRLHDNAAWVSHHQEIVAALAEFSAALRDAEAPQQAYFVSGEGRHLGPRGLAVAAVNQGLERVRELTAHSPEQQGRLQHLGQALAAQFSTETRLAELRKRPDASPSADLADAWKRAADDSTAMLRALGRHEQEILEDLDQSSRDSLWTALIAGLVTTLLGLGTIAAMLRLRQRHRAARAADAVIAHDEQELLHVTLDRIDAAVLVIDPNGMVTLVNPAAHTLTGWAADEAVGKHVSTICRTLSADTRQPSDNPALQALRWGRVVEAEGNTLLLKQDGRACPIVGSAAPLRRSDGKANGAVLVLREARLGTEPIHAAIQALPQSGTDAEGAKS